MRVFSRRLWSANIGENSLDVSSLPFISVSVSLLIFLPPNQCNRPIYGEVFSNLIYSLPNKTSVQRFPESPSSTDGEPEFPLFVTSQPQFSLETSVNLPSFRLWKAYFISL